MVSRSFERQPSWRSDAQVLPLCRWLGFDVGDLDWFSLVKAMVCRRRQMEIGMPLETFLDMSEMRRDERMNAARREEVEEKLEQEEAMLGKIVSRERDQGKRCDRKRNLVKMKLVSRCHNDRRCPYGPVVRLSGSKCNLL